MFDDRLYEKYGGYSIGFGGSYTYKITIEYDDIKETYIANSGEKGWENSCGNKFVVARDSKRYGAPNKNTSFTAGYNVRLPDEWHD